VGEGERVRERRREMALSKFNTYCYKRLSIGESGIFASNKCLTGIIDKR